MCGKNLFGIHGVQLKLVPGGLGTDRDLRDLPMLANETAARCQRLRTFPQRKVKEKTKRTNAHSPGGTTQSCIATYYPALMTLLKLFIKPQCLVKEAC